METPSHAFVTGATGLVGRWLVAALTRRGWHATLLVRDAAARAADYRRWIDAHGGRSAALEFLDGDLADRARLLAADTRRALAGVTAIYHAGALMAFPLPRPLAHAGNVEGTSAMLELARDLPGLRRFVYVSGALAAGDESFLRLGIDPDGPPRAGAFDRLYRRLGGYEASKREAELLVRFARRLGDFPVTILYPSAVIGDSTTGEGTDQDGFPRLVRAVRDRRLPALPSHERHWLPLVTVDYVAEFAARLLEHPESAGGSYVLLDERTPRLIELCALIAGQLGVPAPRLHLPIALLRWLLRLGLVPGAPITAEELAFLDLPRVDVSSADELAARMGLVRPDIRVAIERSVAFIARSDAAQLPRQLRVDGQIGPSLCLGRLDQRRQ